MEYIIPFNFNFGQLWHFWTLGWLLITQVLNYIYSLLFIFFASFWLRRKPCTGSRYLFPENNVFLPFLYSLPPSPETLPCLLTCLCPHTIPFPAALGGNTYFISSTTHCESNIYENETKNAFNAFWLRDSVSSKIYYPGRQMLKSSLFK